MINKNIKKFLSDKKINKIKNLNLKKDHQKYNQKFITKLQNF